MFPYTIVDVLKVWLFMDHTLNGGDSNLQPSTCTKRWSYMDHKLLKVVVVAEIAVEEITYSCCIMNLNQVIGIGE